MGRSSPFLTHGLQGCTAMEARGRLHLFLTFSPRARSSQGTTRSTESAPPRNELESMDAAAAAAAAADEEQEDQARMAAIAEGLQTRDAMRLYNWVSQRCFSDCVVTFYREALGRGEADCVRACVRKYLLLTTASSARFADLAAASGDD